VNKWVWIVVPALLLTAGCKKQEAAQQQPTFHEIMKERVDTRADDVWAIGNAHIDANAGIDGASMSDDDWKKLAAAAVNLQQAALEIVNLKDPIVVVKPGVKIADEDVPGGDSAESVKANIEKDRQGLRDHANSLAAAATSLHAAALDLASLPDPLTVVKAGQKIAFEDTSWGDKATSVQHNIDQDPQGLRDLANALAQHTADITTAANKHDAANAGRLINELDGVCEGCHVKYWYPSEKALIESINKTAGTNPTT
jgi:hypothetical protein